MIEIVIGLGAKRLIYGTRPTHVDTQCSTHCVFEPTIHWSVQSLIGIYSYASRGMSTPIHTSKTHTQIYYRKHNTKLTNSVFYSANNINHHIPYFKTLLGVSQLTCAYAHSLAYIAVKRLDVQHDESSRTHIHMGLVRVYVVAYRLDRGQTELYDVMFGMSMGAYIGHPRVCARSVLYDVRLSVYA